MEFGGRKWKRKNLGTQEMPRDMEKKQKVQDEKEVTPRDRM